MKDHQINVKTGAGAHVEHIIVPVADGYIRWHVINRGSRDDSHDTVLDADSGGASHGAEGGLRSIASLDDGTTGGAKSFPEKINHAAMYRPGNVTIACSTQQDPESGVHDPDRGLVRKVTDAVFNFVGYHRAGEPFRSRNSD
jgi:hypothetical protein